MLTDTERSFASDLLDAVWTSDDAVIHDFIRENKTDDLHPFKIPVSFYCVSQKRRACDDCIEMPNLSQCKHEQQRACICADELEYLSLDVLDTTTYHRISTNLKLGMCPHVFNLLRNPSLRLDEEFCQNRIVEWYDTIDVDIVSSEIYSVMYCKPHIRTGRCICRTAAYLESFLFRLNKREILSQYSKHCSDRYTIFTRSSFYHYGLLEVAILTGREHFFIDLLQQRKTRKQYVSTIYFTQTICSESLLLLNLVVEKNSLKLFKTIVKIIEKKEKKYMNIVSYVLKICSLFYVSMRACKVEFIKALLNCDLKWTKPSFFRTLWDCSRRESLFLECIRRGREDIVYLVMTHPVFIHAVQHVLILAIIYDRIQMMEKVLHWYSQHGLHTAEFELDLYTLAVLHSMPQVMKLLDHYRVPETHTVKLSAMDFAKYLGYTECLEILSETSHTCVDDSTNVLPLLEVQYLQEKMKHPILVPVHLYMDALIRSGCYVNSEDPNGITPIQLAIKRRDYKSVQVLLRNEVNLFQGQTFIMEKGTTQLLLEIFYSNTNIYNNLIQILRVVIPESCDFFSDSVNRSVMYFIFHSVHSVSPADKVHIIKIFPQQWFGVKSLQVTCRNALRHHYGRYIHKFVRRYVKPEALKSFILLIDLINQLQGQLNWKYMKFNASERC